MRVVMLVKNSFEYDARVTREATTLVEAGHEVTVVALRSTTTRAKEVTTAGIHVVRVDRPLSTLRRRGRHAANLPSTATPGDDPTIDDGAVVASRAIRPLLLLAAAAGRSTLDRVLDRRLRRIAVDLQPDVIHAHDLNTLAAAFQASSSCKARLVYDTHELAVARNEATPEDSRRASALESDLLPRTDAVITASPGYTDELARRHDTAPVTLLNVPVRMTTVAERPQLPRRRGALLAVYVGSIQRNRGIETAIRALHDAPAWDLAIVGYGEHRRELEDVASAEGLDDRVHFTGPVPHDELVATVATADAGLCPIVGSSRSYELSAPNKLFEYMAAGLPIIVADLPIMRALADDAGGALATDPTDPAAMAAALATLSDEDTRTRLAAANRGAHLSRFNWDVEEQQLLAVYRGLGAS